MFLCFPAEEGYRMLPHVLFIYFQGAGYTGDVELVAVKHIKRCNTETV